MRRLLAPVLIAAACALAIWQVFANGFDEAWLMGDFRAFYCAGAVLLHGGNPYLAAPMLACEQTPLPFGLHSMKPGVGLPAPFPAYALLLFSIFSLLPYPVAAIVWLIVSVAATIAACIFLAKLCDRPPLVVFAMLAIGFCIAVIPYGELAPVIMAALTGSALALREGRYAAAAIALLFVALLPHAAFPVFLALLVWVPRMRLPVVAVSLLLAAIDLAAGPRLALLYVTAVLPSHAASEIGYIMQYSATWLAQGLGASDRVALLAGDISYGLMVAIGVTLSRLLVSRFGDPAFFLLIPTAFAVAGGPFVHYSEITLALPAALLLYSYSAGTARVAAAVALVLMAAPWEWIMTQPKLVLPIVLGAGLVAAIVLPAPARIWLRVGLGAAVFCATCMFFAAYFGPQITPHVASVSIDPSLAEASWGKFISTYTSSSGFVWLFAKLPTWIGLLALALGAVRAISPTLAR